MSRQTYNCQICSRNKNLHKVGIGATDSVLPSNSRYDIVECSRFISVCDSCISIQSESCILCNSNNSFNRAVVDPKRTKIRNRSVLRSKYDRIVCDKCCSKFANYNPNVSIPPLLYRDIMVLFGQRVANIFTKKNMIYFICITILMTLLLLTNYQIGAIIRIYLISSSIIGGGFVLLIQLFR